MKRFLCAASPVCAFLLSSCGGGSGGGAKALERPTGDYVAFVADGRLAGTDELFVAQADGTGVRCVSGPLVASSDVVEFIWSPDRQYLAFTADRTVDNRRDLVVIDVTTGAIVGGAALVTAGFGILDVQWSPDSQYFAFRAATQMDGSRTAVYVMRLVDGTGGAVAVPSHANGAAYSYKFQPAPGNRIAVLGDLETNSRAELYSVRLDGSGLVKLSGTANPNSGVGTFTWSHDGAYIAYNGDLITNGRADLYVNLPAGGAQATLSDVTSPDRTVTRFEWSPTANVIAYGHDLATLAAEKLFTVSVPSGTRHVIQPQQGTEDLAEFDWSPDGSRIAFVGSLGAEFWVSSPTGPAAIAATGYAIADLGWSPDGRQVAYTTLVGPNLLAGFRSFDADTGQVVDFGELSHYAAIIDPKWSPDGRRILVRADGESQGVVDLHLIDVDAETLTTIVASGNAAHDVTWAEWSPDGGSFAWIGGFGPNPTPETVLRSALADGTDPVEVSNVPLTASIVAAARLR